jgi:hypothetical protein
VFLRWLFISCKGDTNNCSKSALELKMFFLKPPVQCTQILRRLYVEQPFVHGFHAALDQLLNTTTTGTMEFYEIFEHAVR